jgi:hypothetical protein
MRPAEGPSEEPAPEEREPAAVVMLPVAPDVPETGQGVAETADVAEVVSLTEAAAQREDEAMAVVPLDRPDPAASELNRKLGRIALGGAAVAGALILALSLGGSRLAVQVRSAPPRVEEGAGQPIIPVVVGEIGEEPGHEPGGGRDGRADEAPDVNLETPGPGPADGSGGSDDPGPDPGPDPGLEPGPDPVPSPDPDPIPEPDPDPAPNPKPRPEPPPDQRGNHPAKHPKKDMFSDGIPGHAGEHGRGGDSGNAGGNGHGHAWGHQHPQNYEPDHHGNGKQKH